MGSTIRTFGMTARRAALLSLPLAALGVASVLAAGPTNIFAPAIDVVHLDPALTATLGSFASVYVSLMNGAVLAAMILFMYSTFRHIIRGITKSHQANVAGFGQTVSTQEVFVDTLYSVLEAGAVTLVALFMIINGANLFLQVASGSQGMFSASDSDLLPKMMGPFSGVAKAMQDFLSMGVILLGAGVAVWKTLGVLRENYYGSQRGGASYENDRGEQVAGAETKPALHRTQALIKELAFVLALTLLGYIVIRQGPQIVLSFLSGISSIIPSSAAPAPAGFIRLLAAFV